MSLAEQNAVHAKRVIDGVGPHIDGLAVIAENLKLNTAARVLREHRKALAADTFLLAVLGRFRNGKSTFLNALLCELTHPVPELEGMHGPLPVRDLPTTATPTTVDYAEIPAVKVIKRNGRHEDWSLNRLRTEGVIRRDPDENEHFFSTISMFKLGFPSKTLRSGITILDTPGTDDIRERTDVVTELVHRVDAAIVLLRSDVLGGQDERQFIQSLQDCRLTDVFFVVNRRDGRIVDEDLRAEAWYRIAELCRGAPRYSGQDLLDQNIFFVDAKAALNGRLQHNPAMVAASGLEAFEHRLSDYLEKNKRPAHVKRFVNGADAQACSIDATIDKLIPTVQAKAEEFRAKYQALQPKLREIHARADRLPKIISAYCDRIESALMVSFQDMTNELCRDLPVELSKQKIGMVDGANLLARLAVPFQRDTVRKEVEAAARSIYQARLDAWQKNPPEKPGAQKVIDRLTKEMAQEIEELLMGIQREFAQIQFELIGLEPSFDSADPSKMGWAKGVMVGALTIFSPDYGYNAMAGGGTGAVVRGVLVHTGTAIVVLTLGGPVGWAFMAGALANIVWTAFTAPEKLKAQFSKAVCDAMILGIRELPRTAQAAISAQMKESFAKLEVAFKSAIDSEIAKEEDALREQMELASKGADDKRKVLAVLEQYRIDVKQHRERLQDALIAVQFSQP